MPSDHFAAPQNTRAAHSTGASSTILLPSRAAPATGPVFLGLLHQAPPGTARLPPLTSTSGQAFV